MNARIALLAVALLSSASGCMARTYSTGRPQMYGQPAYNGYAQPGYVQPGYVQSGYVQPGTNFYASVDFDVRVTPYVVYEGRPTYWYNNAWYYQSNNGWVTYQSAYEPVELRRHRAGQFLPMYMGGAPYQYGAPTVYGPTYAPPAYGPTYAPGGTVYAPPVSAPPAYRVPGYGGQVHRSDGAVAPPAPVVAQPTVVRPQFRPMPVLNGGFTAPSAR